MSKKNYANELIAILEMLPLHIYWMDKKSRICGCNKLQALAAGFNAPEEMIGKTDYDLPWCEFASKIIAINNKVMKEKINYTVEEEVFLPDGKRIVYLSTKMPLFNKKNEVIGLLGVSIDITERKKLEEGLQAAKEKAESANYIMTEFISNTGHDLATPISDVISIAHLLGCYSDEYPELKQDIELLVTRGEDCEKVRKRLINATSISNLEVKTEQFSVSLEILAVEKELKPSIGSKPVAIIIQPIKPKKEDWIETDRTKFHDILFDLMSNAINFTEEGQVAISVLKESGFFHIKVSDTGIGIPADKFDYIFQQYTKLSRSNKHGATFKGVGAGLYLARIRASLLNATISVESEVDKGSVFTLTIPVHPVQNDLHYK